MITAENLKCPALLIPEGHLLCRKVRLTRHSVESRIQLPGKFKQVAGVWLVVSAARGPQDWFPVCDGQFVLSSAFSGEAIDWEGELYYRLRTEGLYAVIPPGTPEERLLKEVGEIVPRDEDQ